MAPSVAIERRQREDKGGDLPLIGAVPRGQQPVNDVDDPWFPRLVGECVAKHMSHKDASITLNTDKGQLSRNFDGDGHLSAKRIGALPKDVWLDVADGIKERFGANDPHAEKRAAAQDAVRAIGKLVALAVGE